MQRLCSGRCRASTVLAPGFLIATGPVGEVAIGRAAGCDDAIFAELRRYPHLRRVNDTFGILSRGLSLALLGILIDALRRNNLVADAESGRQGGLGNDAAGQQSKLKSRGEVYHGCTR